MSFLKDISTLDGREKVFKEFSSKYFIAFSIKTTLFKRAIPQKGIETACTINHAV
jgi:hypothetical protein